MTYAADDGVGPKIPEAPALHVSCGSLFPWLDPMSLVSPWNYHDFLTEFRRSLRKLGLPRLEPCQSLHRGPAVCLARSYRMKNETRDRKHYSRKSPFNRYAQ